MTVLRLFRMIRAIPTMIMSMIVFNSSTLFEGRAYFKVAAISQNTRRKKDGENEENDLHDAPIIAYPAIIRQSLMFLTS